MAGGFAALLVLQTQAVSAASNNEGASAGATAVADKGTIETIIRDYIMNNPDVILESLRSYQAKAQQAQQQQAQQALQASQQELLDDPQSPVAGNPEGDVTVVEFFDYNCGYCKRVFPAIQTMLEKDNEVRYVFKEYPILTESSMTAARAALAAWTLDPDKYLPFHTALMEARGELTEQRILDMAKQVGLDVEKVKAAMEDPEVTAEIRQNLALGQRIGVTGTPAFVIDDQVVPGAVSLETLQQLVDAARKG